MAPKRSASVILQVPSVKRAKKASKKSRGAWKLTNNSTRPFANEYITQCKYATNVKTAGVGDPFHVFRMNSIYDPDQTGVGHQPYGHDQLAEIYSRYRVNGFKYEIWGTNNSSGTNCALQIHAVPYNGTADPAFFVSSIQAMEIPNSKTGCTTAGGTTAAVGGEACYLSGYIDLATFTGRSKSQYKADDRYQATMGTNPAEEMTFFVGGSSMDTGQWADGAFTVKLTYFVECFDSKGLPTS